VAADGTVGADLEVSPAKFLLDLLVALFESGSREGLTSRLPQNGA